MKWYLLKSAKLINKGLEKFGYALKPIPSNDLATAKPYGYIRVLSFSKSGYYSKFTTTIQIDESEVDNQLDIGCDLLIYEPGMHKSRIAAEVLFKFTRKAKQYDVPSILLLSSIDMANFSEIYEYFDMVHIISGKQESRGKINNRYYSIDYEVDNPIGLDYERERKSILIPYEESFKDKPQIKSRHKTAYMPLAPANDIYNSTPISKTEINKTWVAVLLRNAFSSDFSYTYWVMRLAANGTRVVVNNEAILPKALQEGVVPQIQMDRLDTELGELLPDLDSWERLGVIQTRTAVSECGRINDFELLLGDLEIDIIPPPVISVLAVTKRAELAKRMLDNISKQKGADLEIHLLLHGSSKSEFEDIRKLSASYKNVVTVDSAPSSKPLGTLLRNLSREATGEYIAKMDDDDYYGENHLFDLLTAHKYTNSAIVGKWSNFVWFEGEKELINWRTDKQEQYVPHLPGATWLAKAELIKHYKFSSVKRGVDSTLLDRLRADGHKLYSTHRFNFVRSRHSDHTYKTEEDKFRKDSDGRTYDTLDKQIYTV